MASEIQSKAMDKVNLVCRLCERTFSNFFSVPSTAFFNSWQHTFHVGH